MDMGEDRIDEAVLALHGGARAWTRAVTGRVSCDRCKA